MSKIKISDLHPTGSELFFDSEGYMNELSDNELYSINGGTSPVSVITRVTISIVTRVASKVTPKTGQIDPGRTMPSAAL